MSHPASSENAHTVAAGPFGHWLAAFCTSLRGNAGTDVPCGDCTGCCISGYSVQLRPEDSRALARIPASLLVSPAGFPSGHRTMAPKPDGVCQMLEAGKCTIYSDRPQTCLDYDCRIFAAAGIDAGGADKVVINRRVREWRFAYPTEADRSAHVAVMAAASFIQKNRASFHPHRVPSAPTGIAVLAIKAHAVFLDSAVGKCSDAEIASAILKSARDFDASAVAAN